MSFEHFAIGNSPGVISPIHANAFTYLFPLILPQYSQMVSHLINLNTGSMLGYWPLGLKGEYAVYLIISQQQTFT